MTGGTALPDGTCDTHLHFYDRRFPVAPQAVLRPPDASLADYREFRHELGLTRAVVVQPTTYGLDNRLQLEATAELAPDARSVVVVDPSTTRVELEDLTRTGSRGARFHIFPGGAVPWDDLTPVAAKVEEFGWHIQLQMTGHELGDRLPELLALPTPLVIDHIGRFAPPTMDDPGVRALQTLIDTGRCWVKLSAPYLSSVAAPPDYADLEPLVRALVAQAPERMLWASNWPHPGETSPPDGPSLIRLIAHWAGDDATLRRILVDNPAELYDF